MFGDDEYFLRGRGVEEEEVEEEEEEEEEPACLLHRPIASHVILVIG